MLKYCGKREKFLLLSTIFCYLMLDFYVKTRIRISLRDKRLFEITEIEIMRVDCSETNTNNKSSSIERNLIASANSQAEISMPVSQD